MGITLAGVMLLAPDDLILNVCPSHRTDLILRKVNVDRYDDRDLVITNLIDSYDRILAFVQKHLPDPFYLEGIERRSLRDHIFREVASNMLIHREYASGATSRLVIEYGRVVTDNPSRPHGFGRLDPVANVPYQKNPIIGRFFRQIDRADELGSGMRKMMLYGKKYGGSDPELFEGDTFRMIVSVPEFGENPASVTQVRKRMGTGSELGVELGAESELARQILTILADNPLGRAGIARQLGKSKPSRYLNELMVHLLQKEIVEYTIPDKPQSSRQKYRLTEKGRKIINRNS
jgi:ATP-dependent DNA helicase RecG